MTVPVLVTIGKVCLEVRLLIVAVVVLVVVAGWIVPSLLVDVVLWPFAEGDEWLVEWTKLYTTLREHALQPAPVLNCSSTSKQAKVANVTCLPSHWTYTVVRVLMHTPNPYMRNSERQGNGYQGSTQTSFPAVCSPPVPSRTQVLLARSGAPAGPSNTPFRDAATHSDVLSALLMTWFAHWQVRI
jgi:hypothetical protein